MDQSDEGNIFERWCTYKNMVPRIGMFLNKL